MRVSILLTIVFCAVVLVATAQDSGSQNAAQRTTNEPPQMSGSSTLTGCLGGSRSQYYVIEKNGTEHVLLTKNRDLSKYVKHEVTVTGLADTNRDASASSDEGTAHGNRFFSLDTITDIGACK